MSAVGTRDERITKAFLDKLQESEDSLSEEQRQALNEIRAGLSTAMQLGAARSRRTADDTDSFVQELVAFRQTLPAPHQRAFKSIITAGAAAWLTAPNRGQQPSSDNSDPSTPPKIFLLDDEGLQGLLEFLEISTPVAVIVAGAYLIYEAATDDDD